MDQILRRECFFRDAWRRADLQLLRLERHHCCCPREAAEAEVLYCRSGSWNKELLLQSQYSLERSESIRFDSIRFVGFVLFVCRLTCFDIHQTKCDAMTFALDRLIRGSHLHHVASPGAMTRRSFPGHPMHTTLVHTPIGTINGAPCGQAYRGLFNEPSHASTGRVLVVIVPQLYKGLTRG